MELARTIRTEAPMPSMGGMKPLVEGRARAPRGFYKDRENRVNAIRGLAAKLKKEPHKIGYNDFNDNGLGGLIRSYYRGSPFVAFLDAGLVTEEDKGKFLCGRWGAYSRKEDRVRLVKELFEKLEKPAHEIGVEDFRANGLGGLLISKHYGGSAFRALLEAGLVRETDRERMTRAGRMRGRGFGDRERRVEALRGLVEKTGKNPWEVQKPDFREHNLLGMLSLYYKSSPYGAMLDAGLVGPEHEAIMRKGQADGELRKRKRVQEIRRLMRKTGKMPEQLREKDFIENGFAGTIAHYNGSVYRAVLDAGYSVLPWEMEITPRGFFDDVKNRVRAVRWLLEKTGKAPEELRGRDFKTNGLGGMMSQHYSYSAYAAVVEAGFEVKPWEMACTPHNFFTVRENRMEAIRWLAGKLEKPPSELTMRDFSENGLSGLIGRYGSLFKLLLESGFVKKSQKYWIMRRGIRAMLSARMLAGRVEE